MSDDLARSFTGLQFDSVARYTIVDHIGTGGMGVVFLAERESEGVRDQVVLKTIRNLTPETEQELKQEANLATRLRHPHVVRTYGLEAVPASGLSPALRRAFSMLDETPAKDRLARDGGVTRAAGGLRRRRGGRRRQQRHPMEDMIIRGPEKPAQDEKKLYFICMDYIDGIDLLELHLEHLRRGVLMPTIIGAYIISRVARALEYAHNFLIHRDISPGNVLIDSQGFALLSDFGVAVAAGTETDQRAGKLAYIAPEVIGGADFDERVDIYSLGMLAYLIASGMMLQRVPREGTLDHKFAAVLAQCEMGFPPLHEVVHDIPEEYSSIVSRMIAADPDQRPPRAGVLASEIEQKYLYAHGFGPTNKSLSAYISIFEKGFAEYSYEQLDQLTFLRDDAGKLRLQRQMSADLYTPLGHELIDKRSGSHLHRCMQKLRARDRKPSGRATKAGRPLLKVRFGDNCVETVLLEGRSKIVIGRSSQTCDIVLVDALSSRQHAIVRITEEGPVVEDCKSGNGTFFEEQRIDKTLLEEGNRFRIGSTMFYYLREPQLSPPASAITVGAAPPDVASLVDAPNLALRLFAKDRHQLNELWTELADAAGLPERAGFLLSHALIESCSLIAKPDQQLVIQVLRERGALRFLLFGPDGAKRVGRMLVRFKQIVGHRAEEIEMGTEHIAATVVRQVFNRVDFYADDNLLLLSKEY